MTKITKTDIIKAVNDGKIRPVPYKDILRLDNNKYTKVSKKAKEILGKE